MNRLLIIVAQVNLLENLAHIATIITGLGVIGAGFKFIVGRRDKKLEQLRDSKKVKQEKLTEVYTELLKIVSLYPDSTPYDVMSTFPYSPNFHLENFDAVCRILEHQIEDFQNKLGRNGLTYQYKEEIRTEIRNREYYIREIKEIAKKYFEAQKEYKEFKNRDKLIDLYASQEVKDCLVDFEVLVNNSFTAGRALRYNDGRDSKLDNLRNKLEYLMREDIGTF